MTLFKEEAELDKSNSLRTSMKHIQTVSTYRQIYTIYKNFKKDASIPKVLCGLEWPASQDILS